MALINHAKREINAKIVYYGCEGTGKRDSLQFIYDRIKPSLRGDLKSPSTLFFFDFSPFEKPVFDNYRLRFHVYTLPGKVENPAAWKMTLKGIDGLVIVADAGSKLATSRENILELRDFLTSYGVGLSDIPCMLQLNRLDERVDSTAESVAAALGLANVPASFAVPARGEGVLEILSRLSREIMTRIGQDEALRPVEPDEEPSVAEDDVEVTAALTSLEKKSTAVLQDQHPESPVQQVSHSPEPSDTQKEPVQVALAAAGAECSDGIIRIPLELTLGGETRRLLVSVTLEQE